MLPILHTLCIVGALYTFSGEEGGGEGTALPAAREETTSERKMRFQEVRTLTPEHGSFASPTFFGEPLYLFLSFS